MLAIIRILLLAIAIVVSLIASLIAVIVRPFHRDNIYLLARLYGSMSKIIGVKVTVRIPEHIKNGGPFVYICNHQNSWDLFTISSAVLPGTVSIGKKSIKWLPFFGQVYWLSGNILIDRKNRSKAIKSLDTAIKKIKDNNISIWFFPEGTRSRGRGLLPFKAGAFHTALDAQVDIVPICVNSTDSQVKLNRWNNGEIIVEYQEPVAIQDWNKETVHDLNKHCYQIMQQGIEKLNRELSN